MTRAEPLHRIAAWIDGHINGDPDLMITGAGPFEHATATQITFADNPRLLARIHETAAGAVIVPADFEVGGKALIRTGNPRAAFARAMALFHPPVQLSPGIHPSAIIGEAFESGPQVCIGALTVVGDRVKLGRGVVLYSHVVIGNDVEIGDHTRIYPQVTILDRCRIGSRTIIHAGSVIGSDGFGFAPEKGPQGLQYVKIPQTGKVDIGDDVEIGAVNTIDRATFGTTRVGNGVKTDNLVHIAHNVEIGRSSVLVAQVGIAGSTTIGEEAVLAGQAGIAGHITIGNRVTVGPRAGVAKSVADGQIVSGAPEMPHKLWLKVQRLVPKLPEFWKKLADLEKRIRKMENSSS